MTTSTVLKDVVAYVDVWESDKRANYSKTFIQQLQEMGAKVCKKFNKHITHVVFFNGRPAIWEKAKKNNVKLVSVLWIGRCQDDGVLADEALYPAVNDERNPEFKNRKHRCMLPRDIPVRTPENDKRMKKKLEKLMKDIAPKQTMVTDYSSLFFNEESDTVYSPVSKRVEYMAERLKAMKEGHENISPTASQMSSPSKQKPSLGNSPTVFKFPYENSGASVADLGRSPDKKTEPFGKDLEKPWLSPCRDVLKHPSISPLKCPDFTIDEDERKMPKKQRMASVMKLLKEKPKSIDVSQSPVEDDKDTSKRKRRSQVHSCSSLDKMLEHPIDKSDNGRPKKVHCTETKNNKIHMLGDTRCNNQSKLQRKKTQGRRSLSVHARSVSSSSESCNVASSSPDGDDDVFDDFFSSAKHHKKPKRPLLPILSDLTHLDINSKLDYLPKKGKQRRCESAAIETKRSKKRKVENGGHSWSSQSVVNICPQNNGKENLPAFYHPNGARSLAAKHRRQSALPFVCTSEVVSKRHETSASVHPAQLTKTTTLELETNSGQLSHRFQSSASESTTDSTEIPDENQEKPNRRQCSYVQKISRVKPVRTMVMTAMPAEKQNTVIQVVKALGGFSVVDQVCESTTHVISGEPKRTVNVLLGIARGCWILSFEWIMWCLEQRQWIPEEPYELSEQFPAAQWRRCELGG
ncbi:microcephalin isoform X2 [Festucalex cinctus]